MKLLYVISNSRIGGAENYTLRLAHGMRREFPGAQIDCLLTHTSGDLYRSYAETFDNVPNLWRKDDKAELLRSYLRGHAYDLIHSIDNYDLFAQGDYPGKIVQSVFLDATLPKHEPYLRMLLRAAHNYRAIITELPQNLEVLPGARQVSNGIDTEFWCPGDAKQRKVCWVGRLTKEKGADTLASLVQANLDIWFHVVANEPNVEPGFLHREFDALSKVSGNLTYEWSLAPWALREAYRSSALYLHTSLSEAQPGTLLEAMACGCYPVAGAVGGVPDIVGDSGILVSHGGGFSPAKSQRPLVTAYGDAIRQALREYHGDGRERILANHSLDTNLSATARIYREVMAA